MISLRRFYVLLLVLMVAFDSLPGQDNTISPVETITAESIRHHVFFLASDSLEGRYTGSKGYRVAAQFGESQFQAASLEPIIKQGDQIGFLQPVPVVQRTSRAKPKLTVRTPNGETNYLHGKDFRWLDGEILGCENKPLPVVFVGYFIHEPAPGWDDFKGFDLKDAALFRTTSFEDENILAWNIIGLVEGPDPVLKIEYDRQPRTWSDNLIFECLCRSPSVFFWSGDHPDRHRATGDSDC